MLIDATLQLAGSIATLLCKLCCIVKASDILPEQPHFCLIFSSVPVLWVGALAHKALPHKANVPREQHLHETGIGVKLAAASKRVSLQ